LNDIGNIAFYASIAVVGYMVCRAFSASAGRNWLVMSGAAVGGLISCWIGFYLLGLFSFERSATLLLVTILLALVLFASGGVLGYRLMVRLTEPKK
jgi:hypothetical protein